MFDPKIRYTVTGLQFTGDGEGIWPIVDWHQRRSLAVTVVGRDIRYLDDLDGDEETTIEHIDKHVDHLEPDICAIHVSQQGELVETSTDIADDPTSFIEYIPLNEFNLLDDVKTISRSELEEVDRLGPCVDLAVFKYSCCDWQGRERIWDELQTWMRLPKHPCVVPFDRVVLDELDGRVVGFTSLYVPGGSLLDKGTRLFKIKYLQQLLDLADDLSFKYGISHQDIAPQNLVIDADSDSLMLFDFSHSARISSKKYFKQKDDCKFVIFTIYEIITRDFSFREPRHRAPKDYRIFTMDEWIKHPSVQLDHPVSDYRSMATQWAVKRRTRSHLIQQDGATNPVDWPQVPEAPLREFAYLRLDEQSGKWNECRELVPRNSFTLASAKEEGVEVLRWARPAWPKLGDGDRLMSTGKILKKGEFAEKGKLLKSGGALQKRKTPRRRRSLRERRVLRNA